MSQSSNDSLSFTPASSENGDDYEMIDGDLATATEVSSWDGALPIRTKASSDENGVRLQLYSLPSDGALLISCQPPHQPKEPITHVPCDIVLVIDVSGSMNTAAPPPDTGDGSKEDTGLSILDLVKHASRTILETLNENDRLAIVTFSDVAKVIQNLTPMTESQKKATQKRIEGLHDNGITNLWAGIRTGLKILDEADFIDNVQGLYVLTDGMPNHMCPKQGYVNKLKPMLATMAEAKAQRGATMPSIHTFGFGYSIRSDLMQSIADIGNGSYAFIPDAGMIGTVFVHAVANLFTTWAVNATLEIEASANVDFSCSTVFNVENVSKSRTRFDLGNIQYGQTRDLYLSYNKSQLRKPFVKAALTYKDRYGRSYTTHVSPATRSDTLPGHYVLYHAFRSQLCARLIAFSPISASTNEHSCLEDSTASFAAACASLQDFITEITFSPYASNPKIASLIQDLVANEGESHGQVSKAVMAKRSTPYYQRWGKHYLPSLLHAHARQMCNSFKDPGPLMYGRDSPMFNKCKFELDQAFDNLPSPKPSVPVVHRNGRKTSQWAAPINMSRYHRASNACFAGSCPVAMADGSSVPISTLRCGSSVKTPAGPRIVAAVVRNDPSNDPKQRGLLCGVDDLWVTPWHPCYLDGQWTFPASVAKEVRECNEPVYSVLLERRDDPEAHVIIVAGTPCVTLGHGIVSSGQVQEDVRAHAFFGDYEKVVESLEKLRKDGAGHLRCAGIERDGESGLAAGFLRLEAETVSEAGGTTELVEPAPADESGFEVSSIPRIVIAAAA